MAPRPASATLLLFADLNVKSGAVQPAIEELERLLTHRPKSAPALALLGSTHLARREPARATGVGLLAQGKRAEERKELEAALALLKDSTAKLPCNTMIQYHITWPQGSGSPTGGQGSAGSNQVRSDEAVKALDGDLLRGRAHPARRETTEAIQEFQKVLKASPRARDPDSPPGSRRRERRGQPG